MKMGIQMQHILVFIIVPRRLKELVINEDIAGQARKDGNQTLYTILTMRLRVEPARTDKREEIKI